MRINPAGASWRELVKIASKCGFFLYEGGAHTKVKTSKGEFITTIPRHSRLDKELVRGILRQFRKFGCYI